MRLGNSHIILEMNPNVFLLCLFYMKMASLMRHNVVIKLELRIVIIINIMHGSEK